MAYRVSKEETARSTEDCEEGRSRVAKHQHKAAQSQSEVQASVTIRSMPHMEHIGMEEPSPKCDGRTITVSGKISLSEYRNVMQI